MSVKQLVDALKQVNPDALIHILTEDKSRGNIIVELEAESVHIDEAGVNIDCKMQSDEDAYDGMTF